MMNSDSSPQCSKEKVGRRGPTQRIDIREKLFLPICRGTGEGELWGRVSGIEIALP
jgi:hypothetical protein